MATVDANGRTRRVVYDKAGRVIRLENELSQPVSHTYDGNGNMLTLTDANGNTSLFAYDADNNLVSLKYPDVAGSPENIEYYAYDAAGRLSCKTTPNGASIRYLYDPAGNVAAVYHGAEAANIAAIPADRLIAKYARDGAGDITAETDPNTSMLYSYDEFGRLVESKDSALEKSVRYAYTPSSLRSLMQVVDYATNQTGDVSMSVTYTYDRARRLATVKKDNDAPSVYTYDASGRRASLTLPNGVATTYTYDMNDRLLDLATSKDATVLARFAYTTDPTGNRTGIEYADGSKSMYEFDGAYRLTRDKRIDVNNQIIYDEAYTYDAVGNRLTKVRTGWEPIDVVNQYNGRNQLIASQSSENELTQNAYDANGNLVFVSKGSESDSMYYDALGRVVKHIGGGGTEESIYIGASYQIHNARNMPKGSIVSELSTFLYDGDDLLAEMNEGESEAHKIFISPRLDDTLSVTINSNSSGDTYYYVLDQLGTVRMLVGSSGTPRNKYDYTAFGETFVAMEQIKQPYGFTGRSINNVSQNMNFRYRVYDPLTGRFTGRDPIGYLDSSTGLIYGYVESNPVNYVDPYGLMTLKELCSDPKRNSTHIEGWHFKSRLTYYLAGGYKNDPEVMSVINKIRDLRAGGDPEWKKKGYGLMNDLQNLLCPDKTIDLGHQFRNVYQTCPEKEPCPGDSDWEKENFNPFHRGRTCYRGVGQYEGSQCCYTDQGNLDDSSYWMGTYDYTPPGKSNEDHFWDDVYPHLNPKRKYAEGLTRVYKNW